MTEKQERILQAALQLFSENGYAATSTSKVARAAGVSEGLIFRHFGSKEGLLQAIMELGRERATALYAHLLEEQHPKEALKAILSLPFAINENEFPFWKLMYALKWQTDSYDDSFSAALRKALVQIFQQLGYENPEAEADLVLMLIDGVATARLLRRPEKQEAMRNVLLAKYQL